MRKYLAKYLSNKECYSVKTTAGKDKQPITELIAYQYGTEAEALPPCWSKGYEEQKLESFALSAAAFYKQQELRQNRKNQVVTEILVLNEEKVKQDRVWQRLIEELIENPTKYEDKTVAQIKSMISVSYLRQLKAMPRPSDLHRYAVSLWHINKHGLHASETAIIDDDALVEEFLR